MLDSGGLKDKDCRVGFFTLNKLAGIHTFASLSDFGRLKPLADDLAFDGSFKYNKHKYCLNKDFGKRSAATLAQGPGQETRLFGVVAISVFK